jgi:hypothetical protein
MGSNDNSNSTLSISNKLPPSLVHGHPTNVEMSTQVQSEELLKAKEASTSIMALKGNEGMHGLHPQTTKAACMSNNMEQNAESMSAHVPLDSRKQSTALVCDGKVDDGKGKYKSKMREPLLEEKLGSDVDDYSAKENSRPKKRIRKYICEDDGANDYGDQNLVCSEICTAVVTETVVVKDSLPIDKPIWR